MRWQDRGKDFGLQKTKQRERPEVEWTSSRAGALALASAYSIKRVSSGTSALVRILDWLKILLFLASTTSL